MDRWAQVGPLFRLERDGRATSVTCVTEEALAAETDTATTAIRQAFHGIGRSLAEPAATSRPIVGGTEAEEIWTMDPHAAYSLPTGALR